MDLKELQVVLSDLPVEQIKESWIPAMQKQAQLVMDGADQLSKKEEVPKQDVIPMQGQDSAVDVAAFCEVRSPLDSNSFGQFYF